MDDPATKQPTTFHGWSRLPDELKVEILAHNLDQTNGIDSIAHSRLFAEHLTSIIGTRNREFTALALETYYKRNVFKVTIQMGLPDYRAYIQHPPTACGHLIRTMEVLTYTYYSYTMFTSALLAERSAMRYILSPESPLGRDGALSTFDLLPHDGNATSTLWQASFVHLQSLALRFEYPMHKEITIYKRPGGCAHCGVTTGKVEQGLTAVQKMHIALQAAKTTVVFNSPCHCFTPLAHVLARMATKLEK